jgi:ribosomal protein S27E
MNDLAPNRVGLRIVPLHKACVGDLGDDDFVRITCFACGHETLIPPSTFLVRPGVSPDTPVLELEKRVRCRECNARGEALVSVKWGR